MIGDRASHTPSTSRRHAEPIKNYQVNSLINLR